VTFRTEIKIHPEKNKIGYSSKLILLGSCFSDNIGEKFQFYKFDVLTNPFGVLFNPVSINKIILRSLKGVYFTEEEFIFHHDLWQHLDLHSCLSNVSLDIAVKNANEALKNTKSYLETATHIFITLGSAWTYRYKKTQEIVANCHKIPQIQFKKELLPITEIEKNITAVITEIKKVNPNVKFIFTLSPVRHLKDGFIENNLSKAHLLTAMHASIAKNNDVHYFPAYEILMDDLRDYRFYKNDFLHPNELAVDYIWNKLKTAFIDEKDYLLMEKVENIQKRLQHKPKNLNSDNYRHFIEKLNADKDLLEKEFGIRF